MQFIKHIEQRTGVDIGYNNSNLHPNDREYCVGKAGINKNLSFEQIIDIAYKMNPRPNIIVKGGPNAKWYLKKFDKNEIEEGIEKQKWRDNRNRIMWIIDWE